MLSKDDILTWARSLKATADMMSDAGLFVAGPGNGQITPKGQG